MGTDEKNDRVGYHVPEDLSLEATIKRHDPSTKFLIPFYEYNEKEQSCLNQYIKTFCNTPCAFVL